MTRILLAARERVLLNLKRCPCCGAHRVLASGGRSAVVEFSCAGRFHLDASAEIMPLHVCPSGSYVAAQALNEEALAELRGTTHRPQPALNHDLLQRALAVLQHEAVSAVESCSSLEWDGLDHVPLPGTCEPEGVDHIQHLLQLIRDIESEAGPSAEPTPKWFHELTDGKWSLTDVSSSNVIGDTHA